MSKKIIKIDELIDVHKYDSSFDLLKSKRNVINSVSSTFCLAKWLQSTVLLQNGETHSCHHPSRHKINPDDLKNNPAGLHNTPTKLMARDDMLDGIQTKECNYCWNIENLEQDFISDRTYKSSYSWAWPHLQKVIDSTLGDNINPTYLEVSFENTCNFKCIYCSPESSSRWQEESVAHGGIQLSTIKINDDKWLKQVGRWPIHRDEHNPYINAFWEWWPRLYPDLHTFRITGGEPLLSKHTWQVLDYIKENPRSDFSFAINTNMNAPDQLIDKLLGYVKDISPTIKSFHIYTSLESTGDQAEYARHGLNYKEFVTNCKKILDATDEKVEFHFMTTVNILSAPTFLDFLKLMKEFKSQYQLEKHRYRVQFRVNYLSWPKCLNISLLSDSDKQKYKKDWMEFIEEESITAEKLDWQTFLLEDVDQVNRLSEYMISYKPDITDYLDFRLFINECDKRRKTDFLGTFPELAYMLDDTYYGILND